MYSLNALLTFGLYVGTIITVIALFTLIYLKDKK